VSDKKRLYEAEALLVMIFRVLVNEKRSYPEDLMICELMEYFDVPEKKGWSLDTVVSKLEMLADIRDGV